MSTHHALHSVQPCLKGTLIRSVKICPHWDKHLSACRLVQEGLYLPMEQHVHAYCRSSQYTMCSHFQGAVSVAKNTVAPSGAADSRRSLRVPSRHHFRFCEIVGSDQLTGMQQDDAWTVDISEHGLRFASRYALPAGTVIRFFLKNGENNGAIQGTGQVVWSHALEASPLFHAGLMVLDRTLPIQPRFRD